MSATRLLVLATVRGCGRAHGYIVGQHLLYWDADKWANTKTGSIYHALRQLTKDGLLIASEIPATENSVARTDYEISDSGEMEFQNLMSRALTDTESRPDMFCAGLAFMSALERDMVTAYLGKRLEVLRNDQAELQESTTHTQWSDKENIPPHVDALRRFWTNMSSTSLAWTQDLVTRIATGDYQFKDDNPKAFGTPYSIYNGG